jgi:hypothetical protein
VFLLLVERKIPKNLLKGDLSFYVRLLLPPYNSSQLFPFFWCIHSISSGSSSDISPSFFTVVSLADQQGKAMLTKVRRKSRRGARKTKAHGSTQWMSKR